MGLPAGRLTYPALALYAVLSLTAMAPMGIGAALVITAIVFDRGPRGFCTELRAIWSGHRAVRAYGWISLALVLACTASLIGTALAPLTYGGQSTPVHWLHDLGKMWYFAFPLILVTGWRRLNQAQQAGVLRAWFYAFTVLSAFGVTQFVTGWPHIQGNPYLKGFYQPTMFLGHHLSVASIWIFPFFFALELLADPGLASRMGLTRRWVIAAASVCALITLILGYSRTLWLALPIGIAAWGLIRLPKKLSLSIIAGIAAFGAWIWQQPRFQERLTNGLGYNDRFELWRANFEFFKSRPLWGAGFGKNQELSYYYLKSIHPDQTDFFVGHAHNIYLEVLAGTGILGSLAWMAWMGLTLWGSSRGLKRDRPPLAFGLAALIAWLVFLINGMTQVNFWEGKVLHQVMWMAALALLWTVQSPQDRNAST